MSTNSLTDAMVTNHAYPGLYFTWIFRVRVCTPKPVTTMIFLLIPALAHFFS